MVVTLLAVSVSLSHGYPATDNPIRMHAFWQNEPEFSSNILGCQNSDADCQARRPRSTMGRVGCAVTSMTMLYWAYGFNWIPDENHEPTYSITDFLNPGSLNDYLAQPINYGISYGAQTRGFNSDYHLNWWKTTSNFYYHYGSFALSLSPYKYIVPNYDCGPYEIEVPTRRGVRTTGRDGSCFRVDWTNPEAEGLSAMELLDYDLAWGTGWRPPIMMIHWTDLRNGSDHPSHFVVMGGYEKIPGRADKDGWYRAHNPMFHDNWDTVPKTLNGPTQYGQNGTNGRAIYRFDAMEALYRFEGRYSSDLLDTSMITLRAHSPVELQVIDPDGNVIGYDPETGEKLLENSMSLYYEETPVTALDGTDAPAEPVKNLVIIRPVQGNYIFRIFGTGDGPYTIDMEWTKADGTPNLITSLTGTATPNLSETYHITYSPTGEAVISQQANQTPVANAGSNQTGEQSYEITLDGSTSSDPDGDPLKYIWSIVSKPEGSMASLSDVNAASPALTPDKPGTYTLRLVVNDYFTDSTPSTVVVTATPAVSRIQTTPDFSTPLSAGSGFVSFDVINIGRIGVFSGVIDMILKDPDGNVVSSGRQTFGIPTGGTMTVSVPVIIPTLKFGNYALTYTQSDETRTGSPTTVSVPNSVSTVFSFDKITYRARETVELAVNLMNTGKFTQDMVAVTLNVPDAGYTDVKTVSLPLQAVRQLLFRFAVPEPIEPGLHDVNVILSAPSGSSLSQIVKFGVQESALVVEYPGQTTVRGGEPIVITIENTGAVGTSYISEKLSIRDSKGEAVYQGSVAGTVAAGLKKTLAAVPLPAQASSGALLLDVSIKDEKTGKSSSLFKVLNLEGVAANLVARTVKDIYLNTEAVTAISTLASNDVGIENGTLELKVYKYKKPVKGEFTRFLPKPGSPALKWPAGLAIDSHGFIYVVDSGNHRIQKFDDGENIVAAWGGRGGVQGQFYYPHDVTISADGSVYVADTNNHRIQKFDDKGAFIVAWGNYGSGNGQFNGPYGIAVGPDGTVYVADTWNYRIQKFDGNGNFIAAWPTYGSGNGRFYYPFDVAVTSGGAVYAVLGYSSYIADPWDYGVVQKFDGAGNLLGKWGSWGYQEGELYYPSGIAVGSDGSLYITDNDRVQKFSSDGAFLTKWGRSGSADGQFIDPAGIAFGSDGSLYVSDMGNNRVQRMPPPSSIGMEKLFETAVPITQPPSITWDYTTPIGALNATGKLYLEAVLKNGLGQTVAASEYPFYLVTASTVLSLSADRKIYRPGETVIVSGEVRNVASIEAAGLTLEVQGQGTGGQGQTIYTETFSVPAGGSHPFTATATAGAEGTVTLIGTITQNNSTLAEIADQYEVAVSKVSLIVTAPDTVDRNPFNLNVQITNTGKIDTSIQYALYSSQGAAVDTQQITIPAGQTSLLPYTRQINQNTTYTVSLSGDVNQTASKVVAYGEAVSITIGSGAVEGLGIYPEGPVSIPVTVTNTGSVDEFISVAFSLQPPTANQTKTYFLPKGGSITDTITFTLTKGSYQLTATSVLPPASASALLSIAKDPDVSMATTAGTQGANGLIPVTMTLANSGYSTINGVIALTVMNNQGKAVWRGEAEVASLPSGTSENYTINVDSSGIISGAYNANIVLYSASGLQLAANQAQIRVLGPIFEITSLPNNPVFTVGRQGTLNFTVKNIGTLAGAASFKVTAMDVLNKSVADTLNAGEEKSYAFAFTVPEDAAENDYLADYALTSTLSQGTKGQAAFRVNGVKVGMTAALDKEAYRNGETAVLTMTVTKQSATEDGTYIAIIRYGAHHDMRSFMLSSQPATLIFDVPLTAITGENLFYGVHFESGAAISQSSLFINEALPDLAADFRGQITEDRVLTPEVGRENAVEIATAVTNYGKTSSAATSLSLYDGEILIDIKPVKALNPGESTDVPILWNVLGKSGNRDLRAVVDPEDAVTEYSEMNNTNMINIRIPDMTIFTDTDKDMYKIRQKSYITSAVTNLNAGKAYSNLLVLTSAKDAFGQEVYAKSIALGSLQPITSTTSAVVWSTSGLTVDGVYTITQRVFSGSDLMTQSSRQVTLEKAPDFILATDVSSRKIKQGEQAAYTAVIESFNGWNHEVSLSVDGLPAGASVIFDPTTAIPPAQSQTMVAATETTPAGAHTIYLTGQGMDEGEIVSHTVPLTLDVSAFGLEASASSMTINQLETATFPISLTALNGYEGSVNLSVSGLPHGIRAYFDNMQSAVLGTLTLTVQTSKYVKSGSYTLTVTGDDGLARHNLALTFVIQPNTDIALGIIATPGPGPQNSASVRFLDGNGRLIKEFIAFNSKYGANSVSADIDGDGYDEIIVGVGPDPKNAATFRVYKRNGTQITEYTAFDTKYGLTLASADLDGDWIDELIVGTGPDPKNPGTLKVLKYKGLRFVEIMTRTIYLDAKKGINIAAGDIDGDGKPEIITSPGPGEYNPATITVWKYADAGLSELSTFTAFEGTYGVTIAAGDTDGDGMAEIVAGTGPDPKNSSLVRIYRTDGTMISEFTPYNSKHGYGVTVTAGDMDGDGVDEIITGLGPSPQNEPLVKVFKASGAEINSFNVYPQDWGYGVRVNAGRVGQ